jgi:hypothetical protein
MAFEDISVRVRLKLFALWSSVMFFYIYGDYSCAICLVCSMPGTATPLIASSLSACEIASLL